MSDVDPIDPAEPVPAVEGERQTTPFLLLQFFVFPMSIVAVCVAVFVIFGLVASEGGGAREYLAEVRNRNAGVSRRWQAAFELSKVLQAGKDPALKDGRFVEEVVAVFAEAEGDDPRVRRYLALALGRLGDARAVPVLAEAARAAADEETRIYAVWSLGAIGDPAAVPVLAETARHDDAGLRKAAVHALGSFATEETRAVLLRALGDAAADVRWNAALSLARHGDAQAAPVLVEMMDRQRLAGVSGLTSAQADEVLLQAVQVARAVRTPEVRGALERLRDSDPALNVRESARKSLETP